MSNPYDPYDLAGNKFGKLKPKMSQADVLKFMDDPEIIKKAVEGSMERRQAVLDGKPIKVKTHRVKIMKAEIPDISDDLDIEYEVDDKPIEKRDELSLESILESSVPNIGLDTDGELVYREDLLKAINAWHQSELSKQREELLNNLKKEAVEYYDWSQKLAKKTDMPHMAVPLYVINAERNK